MSENAVLACQELGVDISDHTARRITGEEIPVWDLYFPMSKTHGYILEQAGVPNQKIYVPHYIPDPFGQDLEVYRQCRDKLRGELEAFSPTACPGCWCSSSRKGGSGRERDTYGPGAPGRPAALERACFPRPWSREALEEELYNPAACFLVAAEGDRVLGYGGMHCAAGECYVDNSPWTPACRPAGGGLGPWSPPFGRRPRPGAGSFSPWRCGPPTQGRLPCIPAWAFRAWAAGKIFTPARGGLPCSSPWG